MTFSSWRKGALCVVILPIIFLFIEGPQPSNCIRLDSDGGYSLLVGVDYDELKPEVDLKNALANIKSEFEDLSRWMYSSTKRFYIKHVDILLPQSASVLVKTDGLALNESFKLADIQISGKTGKVQVRNSNGCGMPGQSIKVPLERYTNDSSYTKNGGKSLLPYFARYRWGVFEESGMESDLQKYPTFYKDGRAKLRHTSCMDHPIPEKASTSLMSSPLVDNVREFCDRETHNRLAPTPQNILCGYRSAMEVIRGTEDWKYVSEKNAVPNTTTFKLLRISDKPYLYLLLDGQISNGKDQIIGQIGNTISSMLKYLDSSIITQVGIYPSMGESNSSVQILTPWAPTSQVRNIAPKLIYENFATFNFSGGNSPKGNFASALFEVSKSLQHLDHPEGTVVVVLKAGPAASLSRSSTHTFEHDIITSLKTAGVRLHALELQNSHPSNRGNGINLENVVKKIGGSHLALDPLSFDNDQEEKLRTFVKEVEEEFKNEDEQLAQDTVVVYKGLANSSSDGNTFHPGGHLNGLQLFMSSGIPFSSIMVNDVGFPLRNGGFEWNMDDDGLGEEHRYIHHSELAKIITNFDSNQPFNVKFECEAGDHLCEAYMVVTGEVEEGNGWEPFIEISTSSPTNFFDWGVGDSSQPFHIYVELVTELIPTYNIDFTGILCGMEFGEESCLSFPMFDDGLGEPDILRGDGVHSVGFFPERDGRYYVKVMGRVWENERENPVMTRTFDHDSILTFAGTEMRKPTIRRINDLRVVDMNGGDGKEMELEWTAPVTYAADGKVSSATTYDLRYASNYTDLIENFDRCHKPRVQRSGIPKPETPGTKQRVKVVGMEMDEDEADVFFAMRSSASGIQSEASNMVSSGYVSPPVKREAQKMIQALHSVEKETTTKATDEMQPTTLEDMDPLEYSTETEIPQSPKAFTEEPDSSMLDMDVFQYASSDTETPHQVIAANTEAPQFISDDTDDPVTDVSESTTNTEMSTDADVTSDSTDTESPTTETDSDLSTTTEELETSTVMVTTTPTITTSTTSLPPTRSTSAPNIPDDEQFFKKPIGYITAGVGGGVILIGLAAAIGYMYWKRKRLIDSGRLRLHNV